ncbi:MAG: restriction endonuclease subunit S [Bacteroidales bacterium]
MKEESLYPQGKKSVDHSNYDQFLLKNGDIVFARTGATVGKTYMYDEKDGKLVFAGFLIRYRPNTDILLPYYLQSYTLTPIYLNWVKKVSMRSGQPGINAKEYSSLKIPLPPLPEQKKIAEILSTWDITIEKQNELIHQLELRKRGLMQQLLTGKKRIKGFNKEWKKYKLQDIGTTYNGLKGKNKNNFGFGKPYISYLNVFNNTITDTSSFDYVDVKEHENQNKVQFGDIFFTVSSETPHEVGMTSVLLEKLRDTYLNSFCFGFRLNDFSIINPYFIGYYLRNKDFRKKIFKLSQGATRYNLSKKSVLKISITIPTLPEQTAIAEVLTNSDKEIELEKQKLSALQSQKKGLIQVLLSGKIRVTI